MSRRKLYHGQPSDSSAAVYTSTNSYTTIAAATVQNTTAGALTLGAWVVSSGGSAVDANLVFEDLSIPANSAVGLPLLVAQTMGKDDELHMVAESATSLTVLISGDVSG